MPITDSSIIVLDKFIQATRDSGYKGTTSALAELVDNSLQAGAQRISITVVDLDGALEVAVLDNGCGMDRATLRQALRFGGSSRFNDRSGLGRFGMGLPNASLSQARHVDVYSWQQAGAFLYSYLDVDEIAQGKMVEVPQPRRGSPPTWPGACKGRSGTLIIWRRCDRLDHRRASTITRKVTTSLGRIFRHAIWEGVRLEVNHSDVSTIDPLYLHPKSIARGGRIFSKPTVFEVRAPSSNGHPEPVGKVKVTFSELPVHEWHAKPNDEKRSMGVSNGAGVSVVRCGREIDYGWFFMGQKRRENYDDWWRCEVAFDPVLDEAFGITHTKQQVRPRDFLLEALTPHIETMAKTLNARVRSAHQEVKVSERAAVSEQLAGQLDRKLRPIPRSRTSEDVTVIRDLTRKHPTLQERDSHKREGVEYRIIEDRLDGQNFFSPVIEEDRIVVAINPGHPFYKMVYKPLLEDQHLKAGDLRRMLELLILAAARAEALANGKRATDTVEEFRKEWSRTLAVFLNG